jgi:hypothetical protein
MIVTDPAVTRLVHVGRTPHYLLLAAGAFGVLAVGQLAMRRARVRAANALHVSSESL